MRELPIRTIGATLVLSLVGLAAVIQMRPAADIRTIDLATGPGSDTTTATVPPSTTTTIPRPFVYRIGVLAGLTSNNFWALYGLSESVWDAYILGPTKPALFTLDPVSGEIVPELATDMPAAEEINGTWQAEVILRSDHFWSDGEPIDAHDVAFTYDTARALELGGAWAEAYPDVVNAVVAVDETTVRIEFVDRPSLHVWPHAAGTAPVMPEHVWADSVIGLESDAVYRLDGSGDVGGGQLALGQVSADLVVSTRNPGHPGDDIPDVVEYHVFPDESSAVAALREGGIDTILSPAGLTPAQLAGIEPGEPIKVVSSPSNGIRYLGFNLQRAPMSEHAFRAALALLLDREELPGGGEVAFSYVGPANSAWHDPDAAAANTSWYRGPLADRLEQALVGLRGSGYTWESEPAVTGDMVVGGSGLRIGGQEPPILTILTPGDAYDPERPEQAEAVAEVLGWLGFDARPVETDFDTVVDLAFTPDEGGNRHYDMYLLGWTLGNPALPDFYRTLFAAGSRWNNTGYSSEEFTERLAAFESAFTREQAREAMWEMERILAEDLPYLLLRHSSITEVFRSDRVAYRISTPLGGLQARLGGIGDVEPVTGMMPVTLGG